MASLTLQNLSKRFGEVHALREVSCAVREGEFFVLLGPTGAGKTTTLRCIAGLEKPDAGEIRIDADVVNDWSAARRDVALVFQQYSLYPNYTVRENLEFPLRSKLRRTPADEIRQRVQKAAETVRITHLLERRTDRLSGGEMQRVSIGRAIVRQPRLFLMDEPLSNLDAKLRELLRAELQELQHRLGATLVFVTHDQVEALTMGDRLGVLREGELVQVGTPYDVYNRPADTFVAAFVGTPAINLFDAEVGPNRLTVMPGEFEVGLDGAAKVRVHGLAGARSRVRVGVRPEHISLVPGGGVAGTVYGAEDHGVEKIVTVRVGDHRLRATVPSGVSVALDDAVRVRFATDALHLFDPDTGRNLESAAR